MARSTQSQITTKSELIDFIAEDTELSKAEVEKVLDALVTNITEDLGAGQTINLPPLGKFEVSVRSARYQNNPQTGGRIHVPAKRVVKFKPAKALKDRVEGSR